MKHIRRFCCLLLCGILLAGAPRARAEEVTAEGCIQKLIAYYFHYRDQAAGEIGHQLAVLEELDPRQGAIWQEIMDRWAWANEEMPVYSEVLPDGLPEDDSLCIVVLGYGLEKDGGMKQELLDRLEVAYASAEKYPRAYVLCTGGETSAVPGISEAGEMGQWLLDMGLEEDRLILETKSLSTTENARNSCRLLRRDYPQVNTLAMVTSDYHIRWGTVSFQTETILGSANEGKPPLEIAGNAACATDRSKRESMFSQAWNVSILADVPFDSEWVPELYITEETEPAETTVPAPVAISQPPVEEAPREEPVLPLLLGLGAVVLLIFAPKRKRK